MATIMNAPPRVKSGSTGGRPHHAAETTEPRPRVRPPQLSHAESQTAGPGPRHSFHQQVRTPLTMIIRNDYKFYAAHHTEELRDNCRNLQEHRYGISCFFEVERTAALPTLFQDFDRASNRF